MTSTRAYVFMLILALALGDSSAWKPYARKKFHVLIFNEMQETLTIHCKSKDDDLGQHELNFNQEFDWSFRTNFWGTTLFWCNFWWGSNHGSYNIFDAFKDYFTCGYDKQCYWHVQEDGLYSFNHENGKYELKYPWPK